MPQIHCRKCDTDQEGFEKAPYPGALGQTILEQTCPACYEAWQKFSVMVINDFRLKPYLPQDKEVIVQNMKKFLNLTNLITSK